jgi:hypothetical protein
VAAQIEPQTIEHNGMKYTVARYVEGESSALNAGQLAAAFAAHPIKPLAFTPRVRTTIKRRRLPSLGKCED